MRRGPLQNGEPVVFLDRDQREHFATLEAGGKVNIRGHHIPYDTVIGQADGLRARSHRGHNFRCFRATLNQYSLHMTRHAQIIYPKDTAAIMMYGDIFPGARVVEGGMGSGALTMGLLRAVGESGHVTTYELREEAANRARKNVVGYLGETPNHVLKIGNVYETIDERDVDRIVLDVPEPWEALETCAAALVDGGMITSYVPTALQLHRLTMAMRDHRRWAHIHSIELIFRPWFVNAKSCRPDHRALGHTGFLLFARRVARLPSDGATPETVEGLQAPTDTTTVSAAAESAHDIEAVEVVDLA